MAALQGAGDGFDAARCAFGFRVIVADRTAANMRSALMRAPTIFRNIGRTLAVWILVGRIRDGKREVRPSGAGTWTLCFAWMIMRGPVRARDDGC
jgi:hypothetical protein